MQKQRFSQPSISLHLEDLKDDFPIGCFEFIQHATYAKYMHYHNSFEIGYCTNGNGLFFVDSRILSFKQGDVTLIFPGQPHIAHSPDEVPSSWYFIPVDLNRIFIHSPQLIARIMSLQSQLPTIISKESDEYLSDVVRLLISELTNKYQDYEHIVKQLLNTFIIKFLRYQEDEKIASPSNSSAFPSISPALNHIYTCYSDDISIPELAQLCHLSETHFRTIFKKVTAVSPLQFLNSVRLQMSKTLLKCTELSVLEISQKVGYKSISSFNRTFKSLYGIAPIYYRKQT